MPHASGSDGVFRPNVGGVWVQHRGGKEGESEGKRGQNKKKRGGGRGTNGGGGRSECSAGCAMLVSFGAMPALCEAGLGNQGWI